MRASRSAAWLLAVALCGCASRAPAPAPTLKSLEGKAYPVPAGQSVQADNQATIDAYREFLKKAPQNAQRPEALRRLGDLEMESADARAAADEPAPAAEPIASVESSKKADLPSYQRAVSLYVDLLRSYPHAPDNDRVLYQLAHAYELSGDLEHALEMLERLLRQYPDTGYRDEAQFRRGELLFTTRNYAGAEQAYSTVLASARHTPYFERALYMRGWSLYKQGRLEDALQSFFGVLDLKLIAREGEAALPSVTGLSRGDRELVEDTLRVTSLCLENLNGPESIPAFMGAGLRRDYEFRIYQQLGDLYLKQERIKDAADTFSAFARRNPLHAQAPQLSARVIEIYEKAGFQNLALLAKQEFVERYGAQSGFRKANPAGWERAQPLLKADLNDLTRHYHALAQKSKKHEDYQIAVCWYRELIDTFPTDPQAAQANFLLGELLFEDHRYAEAAPEYEKAAYFYLPHPKSADAGYAALLAYTEQEKAAPPEQRASIEKSVIESALRFGETFPKDPRRGAVLVNASERLYALHDLERASSVAGKALKSDPALTPAQQRVAWTVIAHSAFDANSFAPAEQAYVQVLALTPENDPGRGALVERLAASVYKQGEQAQAAGRVREAVALFDRVGVVAPSSPVRAAAQFDAAAALIGLKDWSAAARTLEDFRARYPGHALQPQVGEKLALVYTESQQWDLAAGELERLATLRTDPKLARATLWQAAQFHEKAKSPSAAVADYERYIKLYPDPLEPSVEARARLIRLSEESGNTARTMGLQRDLVLAESAGGAGRTDRTRFLGANAALALAAPVRVEYEKVQLVEPLKKQLKAKKARMEDTLKAYAFAADYGVADVATAATYRTAELYEDFGKALLQSQRPKGLSKDELEQYDVMLEEQAYPFEEKAIAMHEANARHAAQGVYNQWVKDSLASLAKLRPVRYARSEQSESAIDAIR